MVRTVRTVLYREGLRVLYGIVEEGPRPRSWYVCTYVPTVLLVTYEYGRSNRWKMDIIVVVYEVITVRTAGAGEENGKICVGGLLSLPSGRGSVVVLR